jgi:uncharacterized protein YjbJ (UPF0337 family)
MNSDQFKGKWKQMKGSVKERWGKLTDDDLDVISGQQDQLVGKIQERYGIAKPKMRRAGNTMSGQRAITSPPARSLSATSSSAARPANSVTTTSL